MLDYLSKYGAVSFEDVPLCDVDRLIFAQLAYMDFEQVDKYDCPLPYALAHAVWADSSDPSEDRFSFQKKDDRKLAQLAASSLRYSQVRFVSFVRHLDAASEIQFAALALCVGEGHLLIAFRGTDNTLAGWKEDFNMAFMDEVPAQRMARIYIEETAPLASRITVCGHSKGGNLALYAAAMCRPETQEKIDCAVSFDGPGLNERIIHSEGFARMQEHMRVILPRDSLVGRLFEQPDNIRIVDSRVFSLLQHYPYFWKTRGMDFIDIERPGRLSAILGQSLCGLMERLDTPSREQLIESVYDILSASEADTFNDFASSWLKSSAAVVSKLFHTDSQTRRLFQRAINAFFTSAAQVIGERRRSD